MNIPDWLRALLTSRKFWLAIVATVTSIILYIKGLISAEQLSASITALAAVVIGGIAYEDGKEKGAKSVYLPTITPDDEE